MGVETEQIEGTSGPFMGYGEPISANKVHIGLPYHMLAGIMQGSIVPAPLNSGHALVRKYPLIALVQLNKIQRASPP